MIDIRVGHGYDVHKLTADRDLILGGVKIPYTLGLLGHSDADVLVHAVMDALLGAAALGDIGKLFPDSDENYLGADKLLCEVKKAVSGTGYIISNVDAIVIAQAPKLATYIPMMRQNIADALELSVDRISVKATTEEKLGFTGRGEGISAHAVCLITRE